MSNINFINTRHRGSWILALAAFAILATTFSLTLSSCGNNSNEPSEGEIALKEIKDRLFVDNWFRFGNLDEDGQYYSYCYNKEVAKTKMEEFIGHELVNDQYTLTLPGDYGYVKVMPGTHPAIYYTVYISLKGNDDLICNITDIEYFSGDNFSTMTSYCPRPTL